MRRVDLDSDRIEVYRLQEDRYGSPALVGRGETLSSPLLPSLEASVEDLLGPPPSSLDPSCQFMVDGEARYPPQPEAMALDDNAGAGFGGEIGPGETVEDSALYFDVPKGSHPDALELHETCEDPGVRIVLDAALRSDRL